MPMLQLAAPVNEARDLILSTIDAPVEEVVNNASALAFSVAKVPTYLPDGRASGHFATVRTDTHNVLGHVGTRYTVAQNAWKLNLMEVARKAGKIRGYSNAGTFDAGAIVWLQAEIGDPIWVGPHEVKKYLTLAGSHDGSSTDRWVESPTVVVCKNTLAMARATQGGTTLRHTRGIESRYQNAIAAIERAQRHYETFAFQARALLAAPMTRFEFSTFVDKLIPVPVEREESSRTTNVKAQIVDLFDRGMGQEEVRNTRWAANQAVTEYTDHYRSTRGKTQGAREESRLQSAWLGTGATLKSRAWELLTENA